MSDTAQVELKSERVQAPEPGYERLIGTPDGDKQGAAYNAGIQEGALKYAMIECLRKPPPGFEVGWCMMTPH